MWLSSIFKPLLSPKIRERKLFPKQDLHWWGSHGLVLVPWISSILWSGSAVQKPPTGSPPWAAASFSQEPGSKIQESGNLEIQQSGNLEIWDPTKSPKQIIKIKIRVAKNVGKVWIGRKKHLPAPFAAISGQFFHGPNKKQNTCVFCLFSLVGQWALFTRFGVMCWCHRKITWCIPRRTALIWSSSWHQMDKKH